MIAAFGVAWVPFVGVVPLKKMGTVPFTGILVPFVRCEAPKKDEAGTNITVPLYVVDPLPGKVISVPLACAVPLR